MPIAILAAATLPFLLYLPGWALSVVLPFSSTDRLARHYERLAVGALWHGWLALLLASLGVFSLWLHLLLTSMPVLALVIVKRRHPLTRPPADSVTRSPYADTFFIAALLVALILVAQPFQVILGVRDAGVYANTGFAIARTGSLVQSDPLLSALGAAAASDDPALVDPARQAISNFMIGQPRDRFIATRLRAAGFFIYEDHIAQGEIVPQGLHLFPAWIALLTALGGQAFGLFAPGLLGWLGVASAGMLGRRLGGPWVGALAVLFLGLNGVQVWFSRYSTAETTAQFLIWTGLYFFARAYSSGERNLTVAALAGIAIGQVALTRIDFFLLGPLLIYLAYRWVARRWSRVDTGLGLGLGAMLLHAGLHIALIARAYFFDTGHDRLQDIALVALASLPFLSEPVRAAYLAESALARPARLVIEIGLVVALLAAVLFVRSRIGWIRAAEHWITAQRRMLLNLSALALLLIGAYAYFIRPQILDGDLLFNLRGGWSDPLTRDPQLVARDVREGRMTIDEARLAAGVVFDDRPRWEVSPDLPATEALRDRLRSERGPWQGPFSNQTTNWLRLQGYIGAPIRLPLRLWYNEYADMNWWQRLTVDPATLTSEPAPINDKYLIPLANLVRVGWYLSPLGVVLGLAGFALWWRRDMSAASWLFFNVALIGTAFYVRQTYGTSDQHYIYILRRFVPIAYPAFSLGAAYALVTLAGSRWLRHTSGASKELGAPVFRPFIDRLRLTAAVMLATALTLFFGYTNRPIYTHTEYAGAINQVAHIAGQFDPERDVLLMRGGAPVHAAFRDVPDLLATPLRFAYGIDAFTVKSTQPGAYAADLARQVQHWRESGREVYLLLSASGAGLVLPGFALEPVGSLTLDLPEFEQLTDQKPRNVSRLMLPFQVYRLVPAAPEHLAAPQLPLAPDDFAAQVQGFYRPEQRQDATSYAWSDGAALLRLPWTSAQQPQTIELALAAGDRPAHLGAAEACVGAQVETAIWPLSDTPVIDLGCVEIVSEEQWYRFVLDPQQLPPASGGTLLLHIDSEAWVPAAEDSRRSDQRAVGVQFGGLRVR
jgi:hypothetical protein